MLPTRQGSIRLFGFLGISVYLHWSWFIVAIYVMQFRRHEYGSGIWNVLEYVALFAIVLMHEFGHALACRQVGGKADQIVLWPLGGVAYVAPPVRPGATLWSIAAGPLVNVALFPVTGGLVLLSQILGWSGALPDLARFVWTVFAINLVLLIFNLLPIYPLDGGQIFRALLWFVVGRARSLMIASVTGLIGVALFILWALYESSLWLAILCVFVLLNCWRGLVQARALLRMDRLPRREGLACPSCKTAPPRGDFWGCGQCRRMFDLFETRGFCPHCGAYYANAFCLHCGETSPSSAWENLRTEPPPLDSVFGRK